MDDKQKQITDFFEIVNTMDRLISENQNLKNAFSQFSQRHFGNTAGKTKNNTQYRTSNKNLVRMLLEATAKKNFDPEFKQFAAYIFLIGGRKCYRFISSNLPLPKLPTITKFVHNSRTKIKEGEVRAIEKKRFHRHFEFSCHFEFVSLKTFFLFFSSSKSRRKCLYIFIKD
jgi:hypothetical protein